MNGVVLVAHRAGNAAASIGAAAAVADLVEFDVHVFRGRVEVRHAKVLWPLSRQWEKWYLLPKDTRAPTLAEQLAMVDPSVGLFIDVKCITRRSALLVARELAEHRVAVVSGRSWWALQAFRSRPDTRIVRSCGNRLQVACLLAWQSWPPSDGIAIHERFLTLGLAKRLQHRTRWVFAWGVSDAARASELADLGASGLIIDDLNLVANLGEELGG